MKPLVSVKSLAKLLGVSTDWVRNGVKSGELPTVPNLGRHIRFHPDVIEAMFGPRSLTTEEERAGHLGHSYKWRKDG